MSAGGAQLVCDLGPFEVAAQGGVRDPVFSGERPQRFSGRRAADQGRIGQEAAEAIPTRLRSSVGSGVVCKGAEEDRRVDQCEHVLAGA
jgi:hypothetical protein